MLLAWLLAAVHLLALGIGYGAVWTRGRELGGSLDATGLRRVFFADSLWGLAAILWLTTGLWRAFGGVEKGTAYYLANHAFHAKMGLFVLITVLEVPLAITFIRWRRQVARGEAVDTSKAPRYAVVSRIQGVLLVLMVLAATAMARGMG